MKFLVIVLIFVTIIYQLYSEFKFISVKDSLAKKLTLQEKLMIPYGMEEKYAAIFNGSSLEKNTKVEKIEVPAKSTYPIKIQKFWLDDYNNLMSNIIIGNRSGQDLVGNISVNCNVLYKDKVVDFFYIQNELNLKNGKGLLLKNVKLGYLTSSVIDDIKCKIVK